MKKYNKMWCFFSALLLLGTIIVCPLYAEEIKVGVMLPLTGKLAKFGEIEKQSFLMAVNEINAVNGINGNKIDLIIEDTEGKAEIGRLAVEKLISQDGVIVIAGGCSSTATWAAVGKAQQRGIPFLVTTASADKITETGWDYVFRLAPPASEHSRPLASFLTQIAHVKTAAIVYENTFGQYGAKKFSRLCRKLGLKVVIRAAYEASELDFKQVLTKVKNRKPSLVYVIPYAMDIPALMQQAKEVEMNPGLLILGSAGRDLPELPKDAWYALEYACSTSLWVPSIPYPGARKFYNRFVATYDSCPGYHGAQAYAAMYVICDALKRAEFLTPRHVRDALAETDIMTVFGPVKFISYGKKTQQNKVPAILVQWINGKLETIWPKEVASVKYVYPVPK